MSRALDKALAEVKRAEADVAKWQAKTGVELARLAELEQSAGAALLDDPEAEARLPHQIDVTASQVRTYKRAVATAESRHVEARRAVLLIEADEEDAEAKTAEREAARVSAQVDEARRRLEEIDGTSWARFERRTGVAYMGDAATRVVAAPHGEVLAAQAWEHRVRAAVARHVHTHGGPVPTFVVELATAGGPPLPSGSTQITAGLITDGVRDYLAMQAPPSEVEASA